MRVFLDTNETQFERKKKEKALHCEGFHGKTLAQILTPTGESYRDENQKRSVLKRNIPSSQCHDFELQMCGNAKSETKRS